MRRVNVPISVYLPNWLYRVLRALKGKMNLPPKYQPGASNLLGDRDIEWSWMAAHMPSGTGKALDFGGGDSYLGLIAAQSGFNVLVIDIQPIRWLYFHPRLQFMQGDVLRLSLPQEYFDLIINCSTVEHLGLAGRYGVKANRMNGDLEAMACLRSAMKPGGVMLLTVPVGRDAVFRPSHRVYGLKRLPSLLNGYIVEQEEYWVKDNQNVWVLADKQSALTRESQEQLYGLGCFVVRRGED